MWEYCTSARLCLIVFLFLLFDSTDRWLLFVCFFCCTLWPNCTTWLFGASFVPSTTVKQAQIEILFTNSLMVRKFKFRVIFFVWSIEKRYWQRCSIRFCLVFYCYRSCTVEAKSKIRVACGFVLACFPNFWLKPFTAKEKFRNTLCCTKKKRKIKIEKKERNVKETCKSAEAFVVFTPAQQMLIYQKLSQTNWFMIFLVKRKRCGASVVCPFSSFVPSYLDFCNRSLCVQLNDQFLKALSRTKYNTAAGGFMPRFRVQWGFSGKGLFRKFCLKGKSALPSALAIGLWTMFERNIQKWWY